jgi:hypothetical protein
MGSQILLTIPSLRTRGLESVFLRDDSRMREDVKKQKGEAAKGIVRSEKKAEPFLTLPRSSTFE